MSWYALKKAGENQWIFDTFSYKEGLKQLLYTQIKLKTTTEILDEIKWRAQNHKMSTEQTRY
jgi:predicted nucleotidyltransferase